MTNRLALIALLLACLALSVRAGPTPEVRVGKVRTLRVFGDYKKTQDLEAKVNAERDRREKELGDLHARITQITKEIDALDMKMQSDAYLDKELEKTVLSKKLEILKVRLENEVHDLLEGHRLEILSDIGAAVRAIGEEQHFALIVQEQTPAELEFPHTPAIPSVLYTAPSFEPTDLTSAVIDRLNTAYDAAKPR
jgi:Skp family chaperone for outer membrane proteins